MVEAAPAREARSARCPRHGRIYDQRSKAGCPACVADVETPPPSHLAPRRRGSTLLLALIAASLLLLWYQPEGLAPGLEPSASDVIAAAAEESAHTSAESRRGTLDPTPYRALIEAIESVLYRQSTPESDDGEHVAALARQLGERLYAELGPLVGRALVELATFGEIEASTEVGYATPSLDAACELGGAARSCSCRRRETDKRTQHWSSRNDRAASAPVRDLLALRSFADEIDAMLRGGRALMHLRDRASTRGRIARRARLLSVPLLRRGMGRASLCASGAMPAQPALDDEQHFVFAHQALDRALRQIALATTPVGDTRCR